MSDSLKIGTTPVTGAEMRDLENKTPEVVLTSASTGTKAAQQEDDLVDLSSLEDDSSAKGSKKGGMSEVEFLQEQYEMALDEYFRYMEEVNRLQRKATRLEAAIKRVGDNEELAADYQKQLNTVNGQISTAQQNMQTAFNNMNSISDQVIQTLERQAQEQEEAAKAAATPTTTTGSSVVAPAGNYVYTGEKIPADFAARLDAKLGSGFSAKCESVAARVGCNVNDLLAMMYSESGINPHIQSYAGAAVGLIQFMPSILTANGYSVEQVKNMSAVQQLDVVADFLCKSKAMAGYSANDKIDAGTLYAMNFLPATAGGEVLCSASGKLSWAYKANSPLDLDHDGSITKKDLAARLQQKYSEMYKYF